MRGAFPFELAGACMLACAMIIGVSACDDGADGAPDAAAADAASGTPHDPFDAGSYTFPCFDLPPPVHQPTFISVYREIFCASGCANEYCHSSHGAAGGLNLETPRTAYELLVGAHAGGPPASGPPGCSESNLLRVEPGHPERSLLFLKVNAQPPCGSRMPLDRAPLDAMQIDQLREWISLGAPGPDDPNENDAGL